MKRKSRGWALCTGVVVLGLILGLVALWAGAPPAAAVANGTPAPSFSGTTIQGTQVSPASYIGKPLVLLFWGSW